MMKRHKIFNKCDSYLEHRTRIIRQVEDAYDEEENLKQRATRLKRRCRNLEETWEGAKSLVAAEKGKLEELKQANGGTYQTFKYFKGKIVEICVKDRHKREKIDEASMNLAHGDNGMCMEVLRDIKCLREDKHPAVWSGTHPLCSIYRVLEMNRVRKERRKFREKLKWRDDWYIGDHGLRDLFQGNDEDSTTDSDIGSMPELAPNSDDDNSSYDSEGYEMPELEEEITDNMDIDHTYTSGNSGLILTPPSRRIHAVPAIRRETGNPPRPRSRGWRPRRRLQPPGDEIEMGEGFWRRLGIFNQWAGERDNNMQLNSARDYTDAVQQEIIAGRIQHNRDRFEDR